MEEEGEEREEENEEGAEREEDAESEDDACGPQMTVKPEINLADAATLKPVSPKPELEGRETKRTTNSGAETKGALMVS